MVIIDLNRHQFNYLCRFIGDFLSFSKVKDDISFDLLTCFLEIEQGVFYDDDYFDIVISKKKENY